MKDALLPFLWFIAIVGFMFLEAVTWSFIGLWFAIGSIAGLFLSLMGFPVVIQVVVAVIVTALSLLTMYPYLKRRIVVPKTNTHSLLGKEAMLIEPILFNQHGKVDVNGVIWTAISDVVIKESNIPVKIMAIEGNKLVVSPISK